MDKCFSFKLRKQKEILEKLKNSKATAFDYWFADNITRAEYADFLWPDKPNCFKAHFMFHTPKINNGFSDGEKHKDCHWCFPEAYPIVEDPSERDYCPDCYFPYESIEKIYYLKKCVSWRRI